MAAIEQNQKVLRETLARESVMFKYCSSEAIDEVAALARPWTAVKGETLVHQGAPTNDFLVITDGSVERIRQMNTGEAVKVVREFPPTSCKCIQRNLIDMPIACI